MAPEFARLLKALLSRRRARRPVFATETEFFRRAEMLDTNAGTAEKDDAADVARVDFNAMMRGDGDVASRLHNKLQSAVANVTPSSVLAKQHRKKAEPGTARRR